MLRCPSASPAGRRRLLAAEDLPRDDGEELVQLATAVEGGPILVPGEEELLGGAEAVPAASTPAGTAGQPYNPFALPEDHQGPSSPRDAAPALSLPPSAFAPAPASSYTDEERERANALGASNDCREFGWTVQRFAWSRDAPLHPSDLASAQLAARRQRSGK